MKNLPILLGLLIMTFVVMCCEDNSEIIRVKEEVSSNNLNTLSATTYKLEIDNSDKPFDTFSWTSPDFGFAAAITYAVQMDRAGNNFASPVTLLTTNTLSGSIKVAEMNKALFDMGLKPKESNPVEFRVRSTINNNVKALYSNVVKVSIEPYETVFPPLYMIGDATGGWTLQKAVEVKSTGPGQYEMVSEFLNGKFRFFVAPAWEAQQYKWSDFTTIDSNLQSAGDGDDNFTFAGVAGWYSIKVDILKKSIVLTPAEKPTLYMIGDATGGWTLQKAVEVKSTGPGQYEVAAEFMHGNFRFFVTPAWEAQQYKWSDFTTVDPQLQSAGDGDDNFMFAGVAGSYLIKVDMPKKSIVLTAVEAPALYMIGDAVKGWDLAKAVSMTRVSAGIFKGTATFTKNGTFRFFTKPDWAAGTINFPYFTTVDARLASDGGSEGNFKVMSETGDFDVTVNLNDLSVKMEPVPVSVSPVYMIGDGVGGWDLGTNAVEVATAGGSKYEVTTTFTNGGKFRCLTAKDWTAPAYNWSTFAGGTVDARLQNGNDGDGNFLFAGATGSYKITVDIVNKAIVLTP